MTDSKVYELFHMQSPIDGASKYFVSKYGYPPESVFTFAGWLRVGPVYRTRQAAPSDLAEGNTILLGEQWVTVGLIDGASMLTDSGELLDLPALVTVRE